MSGIDADRWLEVDLYWFDESDLHRSVEHFWDRCAPLLTSVDGWRGVIINSGWLADFVLSWDGDLDQAIPFPQSLVRDKFFEDEVPLLGSLSERKAAWEARFRTGAQRDEEQYPVWTYRQFGELIERMRVVAASHGVDDVRIGTFVIGWDSIYACEPSAWSTRHPEAYFEGPWVDRLFNVEARLSADPVPVAAFPSGIEEGIPISRFFGQQWGHLSRALGLNAIVLRDSMIGQGIYERTGPWGATAPEDPARVADWSAATAALVRETKTGNPDALVIGYSNAASAVAGWRVNCVDLESIAREGYLDAWIDQTWAGAWNEVGQREDLFWNLPLLGWTNQLGFVLLRAAELAGTNVRHYVLTETFDAWESWDIIHTASDRLRWGIWAYLHAFLLTPEGPRAPRGTYISWMNQGKRLLSEADVAFLATEIDAATADARETAVVHGATLAYCRPAMEWMARTAPHLDTKEWIDEQAGFLLKFGAPISSVMRSEDLSSLDPPVLIVQTPHHLPPEQEQALIARIDAGRATVIVGSPAGGVADALLERAGLSASDAPSTPEWRTGRAGTAAASADIPTEFPVRHALTANRAAADVEVLMEVEGYPTLTRRGNVVAWDPADVEHRSLAYTGQWDFGRHNGDRSVLELMGSAYPFLLPAREINRLLRASGEPHVVDLSADAPASVLMWTSVSGAQRLLIADLEEGFRASTEGRTTVRVVTGEREVVTELAYAQAVLRRSEVEAEVGQRPQS